MTKHILISLLAGLSLFASTAMAGSSSGTFSANATVVTECAIDGGSISFPVTGLVGTSKIPAQGHVTVECTGPVPFTLQTTGTNEWTLNNAQGQASSLRAQVFADSARTQSFYMSPRPYTASGGVQQIPVYAQVFKSQAGNPEPAPGIYGANVGFTLTY